MRLTVPSWSAAKLAAVVGASCLIPTLPARADAPPQPGAVQAAGPTWQLLKSFSDPQLAAEEWVRPQRYQALVLDRAQMIAILAAAPLEFTPRAAAAPLVLQVPMPDGSFQRFAIAESPVMEPALAAIYPDIRTYGGYGIDDPFATIRVDNTPLGFHVQVLSPFGAAYIDPFNKGDDTLYAAYYKQDLVRAGGFSCGTLGAGPVDESVKRLALNMRDNKPPLTPAVSTGPTYKNYRIAICATGEFTAAQGSGTVADGLAAIVSLVNRISGVYQVDFAVNLILVANETSVIYTNAATDPFTAPTNATTTNSQCQSTLNSVIGSANYDVGHVVYKPASTSNNNGLAGGIGTVCGSIKGQGYSAVTPANGDGLAIDYVAHELGHQFGGRHNFNSCAGSQGDSSTYAVEPGSASTIMGYAGICGTTNLQAHSDPYFNSINIEQVVAYINGSTGNSCATPVATGNSAPSVNPGPNYTIPFKTPFTLTASATDPDGDPITYCWEERDTSSTAVAFPLTDNGANPICRSWNPTPDPTRTVPRLANLLSNTFAVGEILPTTSRTMKWRVTARDNRGGVDIEPTGSTYVQITATSAAGPFVVTFPNAATTLSPGPITVTWNVANTSASPVNCASVSILLSTDGGNTFPTNLAATVPNSGSALVTLPNVSTSQARIKVAAVGNIFFDISDNNFIIQALSVGACCAADGSCALTLQAACSPGSYLGDGTVCDPNPCPQPTGACCAASGSCSLLTAAACAAQSGAYTGDNSACDPNPCPEPSGACCATDGSCAATTLVACTGQSGGYQGDNSLCLPNPCPEPTGACCSPIGGCSITSAIGCASITGAYFGNNSVCTNDLCVVGACCTGSTCSEVLSSTLCSGHFAGAGSSCNASGNSTTPCCRADFNGSGSVTVQDIFDFLSAWFAHAPTADFNQSGSVTVQDIFDFLTAWFAHCS